MKIKTQIGWEVGLMVIHTGAVPFPAWAGNGYRGRERTVGLRRKSGAPKRLEPD